jgi:hypothetical protein
MIYADSGYPWNISVFRNILAVIIHPSATAAMAIKFVSSKKKTP